MDNKGLWIWRMAKKKEEERETVHYDVDFRLALALSNLALSDNLPKGDGKFSRVVKYCEDLKTELSWIKRNWTGNDEELNAYLLGCDTIITGLENILEIIKKGR